MSFFFSSRRRHTRCSRDWSSDVCSSDLTLAPTESVVLATPERALRFAYDDARGAVNVEEPPLQVVCCSVADATRAPAGMHTLKVMGWQPYELKEGPQHWDE